ncbi:hypothetical protein ACLKA6_012915 [Drosophila palustris]
MRVDSFQLGLPTKSRIPAQHRFALKVLLTSRVLKYLVTRPSEMEIPESKLESKSRRMATSGTSACRHKEGSARQNISNNNCQGEFTSQSQSTSQSQKAFDYNVFNTVTEHAKARKSLDFPFSN